MKQVILTKGLPASGKSTWAKQTVAENVNMYKRINKDLLREMLDFSKWSPDSEEMVLQVRDSLILMALERGKHVIIDDCNLHPKHEIRIRELVKGKAEVVIKDFTNVTLEECLKRDKRRQNYVGEKAIKTMYRQFLQPQVERVPFDVALTSAVICDLDGTLALFGKANPYDRNFLNDSLNYSVSNVLTLLRLRTPPCKILLVSGRKDSYREQTERWLSTNGVRWDELWMRKSDDKRKDVVVKEEIFNKHIRGKYNVEYVFDDRPQVCRLWYTLGLNLFKVGDPDAEF